MKKFLKNCWKDILYIFIILALVGCVVSLFVKVNNKEDSGTVYGVIVKVPNGSSYYFKSYEVQAELYEYRMANGGEANAKDLIKEIKISTSYSSISGKTYTIRLIEYDDDITELSYSWNQIFHIEYR